MPTDQKREVIKRFLNDQETRLAVHSFLKSQFLKPPKNREVQLMAACWLAKDLFDEAWKELARLQEDVVVEQKVVRNIGV